MSDLIDRQAAIDALHMYLMYRMGTDSNKKRLDEWINNLPSAQPEPCEDAVSRHRLLSDLEELIVAWEKYPVMAEQRKGVEAAIGYVKTIPSAQPEIVRCKDCKWYGRADKRRFYRGMDCLQKRIDTIIPDKDFCSRAERREE